VSKNHRRWLAVVTVLLGLLGAVAVAAGGSAADRTFAGLSGVAQSLMSITVPFSGVLLARDVRRRAAMYRAAAVLAVGAALVGAAICAGVLAVVPGGRWDHVGLVVVGSVLVQLVAQSVGTGLGLLLRPVWLACLATVVLPLGLWLLLGIVDVLQPAQAWLTPFPAARNLLSGQMSPIEWAQWACVAALWGIGLNALGFRTVVDR
jgi:hypothetical protein